MTPILECVILLVNILMFSVYLVYVLCVFSIPANLSVTYYKLERKHKGAGMLFPLLLCSSSITIIPIWERNTILLSNSLFLSFLPYLVLLCMFLVACSARYKKMLKLVYFHYMCAIIASVCTIIWIFFIGKRLFIIGIFLLLLFLLLSLVTNTFKKCLLFWLELTAFYAIYIILFAISLNKLDL